MLRARTTRLARGLAAIAVGLTLGALSVPTGRAQERAQGDADEAPPPAPAHRLIVDVITRDDRGRVFCAAWRGREGYPTQREHAVGQTLDRTVVNRRAECVFDEDFPPAEYAVAVFHDENANNDLDRNFLGIPSEGTGASNDAYNMFGPPSYDNARFQYPNVSEHRITVHIRYR
ncbi:MAG: DUF2141 domain-containing protein [Sandaracinaceae bacterium]